MNLMGTIVIAGLVVLAGSFLIAGRYTISAPLSLGGSAGGIFVVDRFTGHTRYCRVSPPHFRCLPLLDTDGRTYKGHVRRIATPLQLHHAPHTASMLHRFPPSLIEGRLRRHPEGGAGSGVLRRRLVTAGPGRPGTPPARHYDLA